MTPARQRITSTLILIGLVVAFVGGILVPNWVRYADSSDSLKSLNQRLQRYQHLQQRKAILEGQLAGLDQPDRNAAEFLRGSAPALAAAEMQQYVNAIADRSGAQIVSTQTLTVSNTAAFPRVAIKVHMKADVEGLQRMLFELETGEPAVFIDNVSISTRRSATRKRRRRSVPTMSQPLDVQLELSGYSAGFEA